MEEPTIISIATIISILLVGMQLLYLTERITILNKTMVSIWIELFKMNSTLSNCFDNLYHGVSNNTSKEAEQNTEQPIQKSKDDI